MKTLAILSIWLALPLMAQDQKPLSSGTTTCEYVTGGCPKAQTPLTPDEHDSYVLMVLQDLLYQNVMLENLRTHKAGNDDIDNREKAHAERVAALKQLIAKHGACENGDWNIAKKEWNCQPPKGKN